MTTLDRVVAIEQECSGVWAQSGVTQAERGFLATLKAWYQNVPLSAKQEAWLASIERKVFGDDDDE